MAENDLDLGEEKKSSKMLVIIIGGVLALLLIIGATLYFMGVFSTDEETVDEEVDEQITQIEVETDAITIYHALEPPFIVNFTKGQGAKLLQVSISVLASSEEAVEALNQHNPMIRNNMLMLLGSQDPQKLRTREGKDLLQSSVLEEIQKTVEKQTGTVGIEQVFFTGFVMQ